MSLGPVQVLVVGLPEQEPTGEVLAELDRLVQSGVVRVVDLLLVQRDEAGELETVEAAGAGDDLGRIALALLAAPGDGGSDGAGSEGAGSDGEGESVDAATWSLLDAVPPGCAAVVALIEHVWAGPLRHAMARVGAQPLEESWLAPDDLATLESLLLD